MNNFLYTEKEIRMHADWLLFGPAIDQIEHLAAGLERPIRILDVGCGTGALAQMLETRAIVSFYIGVDLSEENLRTGNREYEIDTFLLADIHNLPFSDMEFDVTVCYGVMQSLPYPVPPIHELHRVGRYSIVEIVESPVGINSFSEQGLTGLPEQVALLNQDQLLNHFQESGIKHPNKILSRSASSNLKAGKIFYRNIPYRIRSIYFWE